MNVGKLRARLDDNGLVPAGLYFQQLAQGLRDANARDAMRQAALDEEDRKLERRYARRSAQRVL